MNDRSARAPSAPGDPLARYQAEVARHARWNTVAFLLYGLLGTTGWRLVTAPTFVPDYAYRLGGSHLAVGLLLFCGGLGRFLSPLLSAAWVAHRPTVKRFAVAIGAGMRLQILGMALVALLVPARANLPAFVVLYCVFNVLNGLQGVVFGLLMAKVIPLARRGRFIGARDFAGGATAAGVALLAAGFLDRVAFPASHGLTWLAAFFLTSLGLGCFAVIREPAAPVVQAPRSLAATLAGAGRLLRTDRSFAWYCAARGLGALGLMAAPYFVAAAGGALAGRPAALAHATVAYFAAATIANLVWGALADRAGFRRVFLLAALVWLAALARALGAVATLEDAVVLFALVGAGQSGIQMASVNLVYELGDHTDLGIRLAVVSAVGELMGALAPLAGGAVADRWSYPALYAAAALCTVAAAAAMYLRVAPRRGSAFNA
jgi:MFS family permease